jgi:hypothetical protein
MGVRPRTTTGMPGDRRRSRTMARGWAGLPVADTHVDRRSSCSRGPWDVCGAPSAVLPCLSPVQVLARRKMATSAVGLGDSCGYPELPRGGADEPLEVAGELALVREPGAPGGPVHARRAKIVRGPPPSYPGGRRWSVIDSDDPLVLKHDLRLLVELRRGGVCGTLLVMPHDTFWTLTLPLGRT